jgi:hypothetical protein
MRIANGLPQDKLHMYLKSMHSGKEHPPKAHKMRKTYASNLNANGVPLDRIREMLEPV